MAEETKEAAEATDAKPSKLKALMLPLIIGVVCGGLGFAVPMMFPTLVGGEAAPVEEPVPDPMFIPFGEVVVNLNEGRMNRYLRIKITLQGLGDAQKVATTTTLVETNKAILTSWMLGYLADMSMEDIRGAAGQNRLRREILDHVNSVLYPDGEDQFDDLLFEEFNVQ
ncbi:MAG: flagellar basal body-associated FliL family protein [Planctomycetales bacterium]|nr:flagellar basal body-associated FliL family protein [Planctomycetales bacterium]